MSASKSTAPKPAAPKKSVAVEALKRITAASDTANEQFAKIDSRFDTLEVLIKQLQASLATRRAPSGGKRSTGGRSSKGKGESKGVPGSVRTFFFDEYVNRLEKTKKWIDECIANGIGSEDVIEAALAEAQKILDGTPANIRKHITDKDNLTTQARLIYKAIRNYKNADGKTTWKTALSNLHTDAQRKSAEKSSTAQEKEPETTD